MKKYNQSTGAGGRPLSDEDLAVEARFNEAHQGMMGILFAAYKMRDSKLRAADRSLSLTIIGGFLGSGKTTLLNRLLTAPHGLRLVVLVNDFGKINIDAELIASQTDDMISLSNGCACCAVSSDLTNNLIEIAEREELPDAIVLEASGVADPNGIVMTALTNPAIRLDGSVVVVDAETMQDLGENSLTSRLFHNQVRAADLVVLSKVDLIDGARRLAARNWIRAKYPDKPLMEAINGDVPVEAVLGIDTKRDVKTDALFHTDHAHDFGSASFTIHEPLDSDLLNRFFKSLPDSLLRAKGVLNLAQEPAHRTIYQRVGKRWSFTKDEPWSDERPHSSIVFIGPVQSLDEASLEAGLESCRAE